MTEIKKTLTEKEWAEEMEARKIAAEITKEEEKEKLKEKAEAAEVERFFSLPEKEQKKRN